MINKKIYVLAIMAVTLTAMGCSKDYHNSKEEIIGTWEWTLTSGGLGNHIQQTPENTGQSIKLKLDANNKYYIYTNGELSTEGSYVLKNAKCIHDGKMKNVIDFSNDDRDLMIEDISSIQLRLSDDVYDGTESLYKKVEIN